MTPEERERAEALINQLDTLARAYDAYVLGLSPLPEERAKYFDAILAYAREERARVWEEARGLLLAQQCHEPFYGSAIYKQVVVDFARWIDKLVDMCEERARRVRDHVPNR